jgi:hypothetical protein
MRQGLADGQRAARRQYVHSEWHTTQKHHTKQRDVMHSILQCAAFFYRRPCTTIIFVVSLAISSCHPHPRIAPIDEGDKIEAEWQLNASDGNGYLSAKYDGGAGVDFNSNVAGMEVPMYTDDDGVEKELKLTKVKQPYAFSFTAPAASECTGVLGGGDEVGVCNFQIRYV